MHRFVKSENEGDRMSSHVLDFLRQKLAVKMQTPIPNIAYRGKETTLDYGPDIHYKLCTASISKTEVGGSLDSFERIARVAHSKCYQAIFIPPYEFTKLPARSIGPLKIAFNFLADLCSVLGIYGTAELPNATKRERGSSSFYSVRDANGRAIEGRRRYFFYLSNA